jgi:hypothetical protein
MVPSRISLQGNVIMMEARNAGAAKRTTAPEINIGEMLIKERLISKQSCPYCDLHLEEVK